LCFRLLTNWSSGVKMRRVKIALTALLIGSLVSGQALAAASPQKQQKAQQKAQQSQQQKQQAMDERRQEAAAQQQSLKDDKSTGLTIHPAKHKSSNSSESWLSGKSDHSSSLFDQKKTGKSLF